MIGNKDFMGKFSKKLSKLKRESGLTLIEILVAVGIFGLVVNMIFAVFIIILTSQRRIIALRNAEDNIRFVIESMSREIRTGQGFTIGGIGDSMTLSFTNYEKESVVYRLNDGALEKSIDGGMNYNDATGPETNVDYLVFNLIGAVAGDKTQPRITISAGVTSFIGRQSGNLKIQTTVSQRYLQN